MEYEKIFYVPILSLQCSNWSIKKEKIKNLNPVFELKKGTYTDFFHNNKKNIDAAFEIFYEEIVQFKNFFKFQVTNIKDFWFEKSLKNNYHGVHNHGAIGYSAVCYVDYCEESHEPLVFVSPFNGFVTGENLVHRPNSVKEGTIIFFPSSLLHFTYPNISEKERLVVSFNLYVE